MKAVTYKGPADDALISTSYEVEGSDGKLYVLERDAAEPTQVPDDVAEVLEGTEGFNFEVGTARSSSSNGPTVEELRKRAAELEVEGRSSLDRDGLVKAIAEAEKATAGNAGEGGN